MNNISLISDEDNDFSLKISNNLDSITLISIQIVLQKYGLSIKEGDGFWIIYRRKSEEALIAS